MKQIKKILVPTDFSDNSELAYTHAREIAQRFGATVDYVHIVPTMKYFSESISMMEAPLDMIDDEIYPTAQKEAKAKLKDILEQYSSEDSAGEAIVRVDRKPSEAIAGLASEKDYDLIVMPSRGRHKSNFLRGSTTEKVIRYSDVPVFTVDDKLTSEGLKRIVVPTDGSMVSFAALPLALSLADIYDAAITFYHVQELYGSPLDNEKRNPGKSEEANVYEALIDRLEDYLITEGLDEVQIARGEVDFEDQFLITDGASSHRIDFHTEIGKGVSAHVGIQEFVTDNADVVVMATHGHSGLAHFFLGSTTEKVAQSVDKPVLTVKPHEEKLEEK